MPASGALAQPVDTHARSRLRWLFVAVATSSLAADVLTKIIAVGTLAPGVAVPVVGQLLTLRLIRNPGAAFSLGENVTYLFAILATAVLGFILIRLVPQVGHPGWAVALGLLVAGVGGNLADRLFRGPGPLQGHVVDFLQLPNWPIFNVADMCITAAAVLIVVLSMVKGVAISGERYPRPERRTRRVADVRPDGRG